MVLEELLHTLSTAEGSAMLNKNNKTPDNFQTVLFCFILFSVIALSLPEVSAYDPLYLDNPTEVLHSMKMCGNVAFGYFGANSYWESDTSGTSISVELDPPLGVLRFLMTGRYGLTNSHTISVIIPAYLKLQGYGDSLAMGIADPWFTFDGWLSRSPMLIARGAVRFPLNEALEMMDYNESDRHAALDGSLTIETPLTHGGITFEGTAGLRYYFRAWDGMPLSVKDSANTKPPIELRLTGHLSFPLNPELSLVIGGDYAVRGDTDAEIDGEKEIIEHSDFSALDIRTGFVLLHDPLELMIEVFYRVSGDNTDKEWGIMFDGTGINYWEMFGGSTSGSGR